MKETNEASVGNIWNNSDFKEILDLMKWVGDKADEYRGIKQPSISENNASNKEPK